MAEKGLTGLIKKSLVAQEEANTILESVRRKSHKAGYKIDNTAIKALEARSKDYVLTAQADKTVRREKESRYDNLTGLLNRRGMEEEIRRTMEQVKRNHGVLHLVLMDLRGFKVYNDTYGHETGDQALRLLAAGLKEHTRPYDSVARWGGEEFLLLIKDGSADIAQTISTRLHESLRELPAPFNEIIADMGMTSFGGEFGEPDMKTLVGRADKAMYNAKHHKLNEVKRWDASL